MVWVEIINRWDSFAIIMRLSHQSISHGADTVDACSIFSEDFATQIDYLLLIKFDLYLSLFLTFLIKEFIV